MVHIERRPIWTKYIAKQCDELFPHADWRVNRELAILLVEFRASDVARQAYSRAIPQGDGECQNGPFAADPLRLLHEAAAYDGWTPDSAKAVAIGMKGTRSWTGGHSFGPFLENIYKSCTDGFEVADKQSILARAETVPLPATVLVKRLQVVAQPELLPALRDLAGRVKAAKGFPGQNDLLQAVNDAIARTVILAPTAEQCN